LEPLTVAFLMIAAFFAGVVDSIAGGGGLVTLPALLAVGLPPGVAIATNKGQCVFGAVSSAASFWRRGAVDRDRAPLAFALGLVGSIVGARLLLSMRPEPLRPVVMGLLLFAAGVVAVPSRFRAPPTTPNARPAAKRLAHPRIALALAAFLLGAYDGFFGPGVGTLLIVTFVLLFGDPLIRASGNAKVVNLASNVAAIALFTGIGWRGHHQLVMWQFALPMAFANASGAFLGARLALRRGDRFVAAVVLSVVAAVVVKLALDIMREWSHS
jgi:uncharacterized membrane protein YfcA